jgi:hypothetical protein
MFAEPRPPAPQAESPEAVSPATARVRRVLAWALVLAPLVLLAGYVARQGVDVVVSDELHYTEMVRRVREGGDWGILFWQQHNEHRVLAMKLVIAAVARFLDWSTRAELMVSLALTAVLVLTLWRIHRSSSSERSAAEVLAFAPLAWMACSLTQYENQLYGMMTCHYFTVAGGVLALWLLGRPRASAAPLACMAAVVAATSMANGLLVFPAGLAVLWGKRSARWRWVLWLAVGTLTTALYFRHYGRPPIEWTAAGLGRVGKLFLTTLGAPLAGGAIAWAITLAIALLAMLVPLLWRWWRGAARCDERAAAAAVPAALALLGVGSVAMVAVGRAFVIPFEPMASRHITHTNIAWYGAYLLLLGLPREVVSLQLKSAAWALLGCGLAAANGWGFRQAQHVTVELRVDQYVQQSYALQSAKSQARFGPAEQMRARLADLRRQRLGAFAVPQKMMVLLDLEGGVSGGEIRADQPVVQRLTCPVDELYDVGVLVMPAAVPGGTEIPFEVLLDEQVVGRRVLEVRKIERWTWVEVPIDAAPLPCRGRRLAVRSLSPDLIVGAGVQIFLAPPYYQGELERIGVVVPERRLALALNGHHFGAVEE